jgi:uncharacterized membrane protein
MTDAAERSTESAPEGVPRPRQARRAELLGFVLSWTAQLILIVLGLGFTVFAEDDGSAVLALLAWCLVGTAYTITMLVVLGRVARRPQTTPVQPTRLELSRWTGAMAFLGTLLTSFVGLGSAFTLADDRSDPVWGGLILIGGIWAMLLSWGLLHWGFAQLYYLQYFRSATPNMRFPATLHPRIIEFVYFAFTLGTSFAASDVEVLTSALRWRVVWHSVLSFFFNGLIIVFAFTSVFTTTATSSIG